MICPACSRPKPLLNLFSMDAPLAKKKKPKPATPEGNGETPLDQLPPHSFEAEAGVLGCILLDPDTSLSNCIPQFKAGSNVFFDLRHRYIYDAIVSMWEKHTKVDIITLQQRLKDAGQLDQIGGMSYLAELPDRVPSAANLGYYAEILIKKFTLRRVITACSDIRAQALQEPDDVGEVLATAAAAMNAAVDIVTPENSVASAKVLVPDAMEYIDTLRTHAGTVTGLATGLIDLDMMCWGLQPDEMFVIAGRPSMGKTALAMNIAEHVAMSGKPVGVFSMEMSRQSLMVRMLCSRARVSTAWVRSGKLSLASEQALVKASTELVKCPLYIDDTSALSILELTARARRMHKLYGIRLVVVDYLQLMHAPLRRNDNRQQEVSHISGGLKALAKDLHVPVLVLSQLNRRMDERGSNGAPKLSDLRESGSIEQDADVVTMLYKPQQESTGADGENQHTIKVRCTIAKNRTGPTGQVDLVFMRSCTRFESAAKATVEDVPPSNGEPDLGI